MVIIKILLWNINQRSSISSRIPQVVVEEIMKHNPDIFVLTEYVKSQNHMNIVEQITDKGYTVLSDPRYIKGVNEVLIACKNGYRIDSVSILPINEKNPNFLGATLSVRDIKINIVGTRIRTSGGKSQEELDQNYKEKKIQLESLKNHLRNIQGTTIVAGDFNNGSFKEGETICEYKKRGVARQFYSYPLVRQEMEEIGYFVNTPKEGYSWKECALDHLCTNKCTAKDVLYDWSFTKNSQYCPNKVGYPDHAILSANITIS